MTTATASPATYTVRQLAERWQVDAGKILDLIHAGRLAAFDVSENGNQRPRWRIRAEDVAAFEEARAAVQPSVTGPRRQRKSKKDFRYF